MDQRQAVSTVKFKILNTCFFIENISVLLSAFKIDITLLLLMFRFQWF